MQKTLLFLVTIFIITLLSCKKDDEKPTEVPAQASIMFTPRVNGNSIEILSHYINVDGYPFYVNDLDFYLSNIRLIAEDSTEVYLSEIEFFSLRNQRSSPAYTIPYGKYLGLEFDLGVPAALNSPANPNFLIGTYDSNHPLSESNGMYWDWLGGYRFFSLSGFCDTVPNENQILPISYNFHSGLDTLFREVPPLSYHFDVSASDLALIPLRINLETFFLNDNSHIDLKYDRQFHGNISTLPLGIKVADNSAASFEIAQ